MTFYLPGNGFLHTADGSGSNQMASEQAFYGLIAAQRLQDGRNSLYRMSDARTIPDGPATGPAKGAGLRGKIRQSIPALSLRWAKHSMTLPGPMPIKISLPLRRWPPAALLMASPMEALTRRGA